MTAADSFRHDDLMLPDSLNPSESSGDAFARRVRRAAQAVLGESETGRQVVALCDDHHHARDQILRDRSGGALVIAVVGATGQGKSWLVKQLTRRSDAAAAIRSGNRLDEATEHLVWIGPQPPADLDQRYEHYVRVSQDEMEPLGTPYMVVDAPGATDERPSIAAVAERALSLASAVLLVVCRDQIRGKTPSSLAVGSEGTIVIPVINMIGDRDDELNVDIDAFLANLRNQAPSSIVAPPIQIEDFAISGRNDSEVGSEAAEEVARRLKSELEANPDSDRRRHSRLSALDARFRAALSGILADQLPGLTTAVNRLNAEARKLPGEVAQTLIGSNGPMQAAVRSRLRLKLLTNTGAIWFPYRSVLGTLNLTHGAWDRVIMSLSGSLPSLVSTIWTSTQSLLSDRDASNEVRDGLQRRSAAAVTDRIGPLASQFRDELAILPKAVGSESDSINAMGGNVASLAGTEALAEKSHAIFEASIDNHGIERGTSIVLAVIGTGIFWTLMAGPFVALYSQYIGASFETLSGGKSSMEHFPTPEFSTIVTSLLLSLLPTSIFAMIALSIAQSAGRVESAIGMIRDGHDEAISELQRDRVLRLRWDDPLLTDAEFLVSAGTDADRSG
ncbi:MAG: hypothetical protein AAFX06_03330 [Planctomycetota bacterium]